MTEEEVRKLRAGVFTKDCTDEEWENVKKKWMRPESIEWLRQHQWVGVREASHAV